MEIALSRTWVATRIRTLANLDKEGLSPSVRYDEWDKFRDKRESCVNADTSLGLLPQLGHRFRYS